MYSSIARLLLRQVCLTIIHLEVQESFKLTIKGGETPINNSVLLYDRLKNTHPEFIKEIENRVSYTSPQ